MELLVVRHAVAVPRSAELADEARPLTPGGRARFRRAVRGLARLEVRLDRVHHSPWLRAVETAQLLAPLLQGELEVSPHLARSPGDELLTELAGSGAAVAAVGHEPWLSELVGWLVTGEPRGEGFELRKGAVARLEGELRPGGMRLRALLPVSVLRRLV